MNPSPNRKQTSDSKGELSGGHKEVPGKIPRGLERWSRQVAVELWQINIFKSAMGLEPAASERDSACQDSPSLCFQRFHRRAED
jgi:hypothetical protein